MSAQTYRGALAVERLREGRCPECAGTPDSHTDSTAFWIPRGNDCSLLPRGVTARIEWQRELDSAQP